MVGYRNEMDFLYPENFCILIHFNNHRFLFCFLCKQTHSIANNDNFVYSFLTLIDYISFSCLL